MVENQPLTPLGDFYDPITGEAWDVIGGAGFDNAAWNVGQFVASLGRHVEKYENTILDFTGASEEQIGTVMAEIAEDSSLAEALEIGAITIVGL